MGDNLGKLKSAVVTLEERVTELQVTLGELRQRQVGAEEEEGTARTAYAALLGDRELGRAVPASRLDGARRERDEATDRLAGLVAAATDIGQRLEAARAELGEGRKAVAMTQLEAGLKAAGEVGAALIALEREGAALVPKFRAATAQVLEAGRAYSGLAGSSPGDLPNLSRELAAARFKPVNTDIIGPLSEAASVWEGLRSSWRALGLPERVDGGIRELQCPMVDSDTRR